MSEARILVAFASKRGSAGQAAAWIAEELGPDCDVVDLKLDPSPDLSTYGIVVLGSGIFAGQVYKPLKNFIDANCEELDQRRVAIFITHLEEGEGIEEDFRTAFEQEFLNNACVKAGVGGRIRLKEINFVLRLIMKSKAKEAGKDFSDYDDLSRDACIEFARNVRERCIG